MQLELIGLVKNTMRDLAELVTKVISYGVPIGVLKTLTLMLLDKDDFICAEIVVTLDWEKHATLAMTNVPDQLVESIEESSTSGFHWSHIIDVFNEYAQTHGLRCGFNVTWTDKGPHHDTKCNLSRRPVQRRPLEAHRPMPHPVFSEMECTVSLAVQG